MRFIYLILFIYASNALAAKWLLFHLSGADYRQVGSIIFETRSVMKRFTSSESLDAGCTRVSCFYDGVRYKLSFTNEQSDEFELPPEENFLEIKQPKEKKLIQCNNVSEWEEYSLNNLVKNRPEGIEWSVQYESRERLWKNVTEQGYRSFPLIDTTSGHSLLHLMDVVEMSDQRTDWVSVEERIGTSQSLKSSTLERKKKKSLETMVKLFLNIWINDFFDPVFGTDCTWTLRIAIYGHFVVIELTDNSTQETFWLVYSSSMGNSGISTKHLNNLIINSTISQYILRQRKMLINPFLLTRHSSPVQ